METPLLSNNMTTPWKTAIALAHITKTTAPGHAHKIKTLLIMPNTGNKETKTASSRDM
jgi:hypothetical protein